MRAQGELKAPIGDGSGGWLGHFGCLEGNLFGVVSRFRGWTFKHKLFFIAFDPIPAVGRNQSNNFANVIHLDDFV
jgi:hypothetical protein